MAINITVPGDVLEASRQAAVRLKASKNQRPLGYHIESYGCQMNDHDSEKLAGMLESCGCIKADAKEADIVLFNTCCVREHAEQRVFGNIGALKERKEQHPGMIIGVCGCMTQQKAVAERLYKRFPFVDIVFGTHDLHRFPILLETALSGERVLLTNDGEEIAEGLPIHRSSAFSACVTIMYGCNNFCTYCIVPYVRGRERSRSISDILAEVQALAKAGYKEVTLLGQNVNSYAGETDFAGLLRLLDKESGIPRIRFMTSHPKDLSPALVEAMATLKSVCNHVHLPVQSGSDRILTAMNRRYTRDKYLDLVHQLRENVPGIELTTDIIVGFPGETEQDFSDTLCLMQQVGFAAAYTFMYSKRTGTRAAEMQEQIPQEEKKARLLRLNELQASLLRGGNDKYVGRAGEVLVEGCDPAGVYGKLTNFKMVYFPGGSELVGTLQNVIITDTKNNSLIGELNN